MIKLHYENEPTTTFEINLDPIIEYDAVIRGESLDAVLEGFERFLRGVYGWIPVDEHLELVERKGFMTVEEL
jgi:hypothetical protein